LLPQGKVLPEENSHLDLEKKFIAEVNDLGQACVKDLKPSVTTFKYNIEVYKRANHILSHLK
jgi:hypothetical protein